MTYDQTKEEQKLTLMSQESGEEEVLHELKKKGHIVNQASAMLVLKSDLRSQLLL